MSKYSEEFKIKLLLERLEDGTSLAKILVKSLMSIQH